MENFMLLDSCKVFNTRKVFSGKNVDFFSKTHSFKLLRKMIRFGLLKRERKDGREHIFIWTDFGMKFKNEMLNIMELLNYGNESRDNKNGERILQAF